MRRFQFGVLVSMLGLAACGGNGSNDGTNNPAAPMTYTLWQNQAGTMPAARAFEAGPFSLPTTGTVTYTITNRSSTSPDHWDISIIPASELSFFENGQSYRGYAPFANVSTQSGSASVPAGSYTIGIVCRNILEDCQFSLDGTMTY